MQCQFIYQNRKKSKYHKISTNNSAKDQITDKHNYFKYPKYQKVIFLYDFIYMTL